MSTGALFKTVIIVHFIRFPQPLDRPFQSTFEYRLNVLYVSFSKCNPLSPRSTCQRLISQNKRNEKSTPARPLSSWVPRHTLNSDRNGWRERGISFPLGEIRVLYIHVDVPILSLA